MGYYYIDEVIVHKATQSEINGIRHQTLSFNLYPNPTSHILRLECKQRLERIVVREIRGATVLEKPILNSDSSIDVSQLPLGIYLIEAYSRDGQLGIKRFVKM